MLRRLFRWQSIGLIIMLLFALSVAAAGWFTLQLRRGQPPAPANFLAAEKGYGVTIDLTGYNDDAIDHTLPAMQANGITWLRQPANWADIEPQPGQFNWLHLDRVVAATAPDFRLILVLQTSPAWARPEGASPATPPDELRHFGAFARALAERYGGQVDFYQIWHEPNLSANWGDRFVDAAAYANLLREAALNIRHADPTAHILTGALAATTEANPLNLNEMAYLDALYRANAAQWFDIVAAQPYGLWTKPLDPPAPDQPNFRRLELLRQVMLDHGDAETPVWATAFGWVALPAGWSGQPSPWSYDTPEVQTARTGQAITHARANWPWLGPMLAARWDAAGLAADDPARGFALTETLSLLEVIRQAAERESVVTPGQYPATHASGQYSPGWRFAQTRADIPATEPGELTLTFEGSRLDLRVQRGLYRGYLWVSVDGAPTSALPQDGAGRSYVVLYDPLRAEDTVTLARYLPPGRHTAVIRADGGWEQWAILGWAVATEPDTRAAQSGLTLAGLLAVISGGGLLWLLLRHVDAVLRRVWAWGEILVAWFNIFGQRGPLAIVFLLAVALYLVSPSVALLLLAPLAFAILLRPNIGLALIVFASFFYHTPVRLPVGSFSPVELALAFTLMGTAFRFFVSWGRRRYAADDERSAVRGQLSSFILYASSLDFAALALAALALLSSLMAEQFAVALREWRTVILESVLFYCLIRLNYGLPGLGDGGINKSENMQTPNPWPLADAFVTGAALQAALALYLYFFTDRSIDAEGVHRALGLGYGSPNNLALALGRAWPILLAVAVLPGSAVVRRGLYGIGLIVTGLALYLTFSKGALILGVPAGLLALTLLYGLRGQRPNWLKLGAAVLGALLLLVAALIPVSQAERFRATFDIGAGSTAYFRLKLWQASLQMLRDFWPLGVGPDNFLYQYRSRYILPEAWQEPNLNHPHNWLLDFGTRLGVGGIALFLWLQWGYWRTAWALYRAWYSPLLLGLMASMVVMLTHGLVDNSYFLVDLAFAFFLNVGLVQVMRQAKAGDETG